MCYLCQRLLSAEIHVISSCTKPIAAWTSRDAIQECREACGGHGYLKGISTTVTKLMFSRPVPKYFCTQIYMVRE